MDDKDKIKSPELILISKKTFLIYTCLDFENSRFWSFTPCNSR